MSVRVLHGDCVELMRQMPDCSVDSVVTDPPYELGFMGKAWDGAGIAYSLDLWREVLRVLKPGGHLLAFGGTRTYHRMACAIEDAGFEIRDSIHWVYGSGFPKSLDVSKAIDKGAGAERKIVEERVTPFRVDAAADRVTSYGEFTTKHQRDGYRVDVVTAPSTDEARRWAGWGTALKPAHEPVVVARKPLMGTVAGNVLVWGTGGLNIDGCRVPPQGDGDYSHPGFVGKPTPSNAYGKWANNMMPEPHALGRWPANIVLDGAAADALDQQSGVSKSGAAGKKGSSGFVNGYDGDYEVPYGDSGGASRFFTQADFGPDDWPFVYCAKPSKRERNAGLDGLPEKEPPGSKRSAPAEGRQSALGAPRANHHPTVKPVALMRHLVRLVTPPGGTVLDPFAGSGTTLVAATLEGFDAVGCEMTDEYLPIIAGRVAWAEDQVASGQPRLL